MHRRDPGLEAGKWILRKFSSHKKCDVLGSEKSGSSHEVVTLLGEDEQPPGYRTSEGSPKLPSATHSSEPADVLDLNDSGAISRSKPTVTKAFTRQVVLNIVGYGILA
jgi:hypothetical protein